MGQPPLCPLFYKNTVLRDTVTAHNDVGDFLRLINAHRIVSWDGARRFNSSLLPQRDYSPPLLSLPSRVSHWLPLLTLRRLQRSQIPLWANSIRRNGRKHTRASARLVFHCSAELIWPTEGSAELQIQPKRGRKPTYMRRGKGMVGWGQGTRGKPLSSKMATAYPKKRSAVCETVTPLQNWLSPVHYLQLTYF